MVQEVELDAEEVKRYITEARINVPGELDLYSPHNMYPSNLLMRVATIPAPQGITDEDELLEYARNNLPDRLCFCN